MMLAAAVPALAQYPGHTQKDDQKKPPPPRATAVLEWTGDAGKPKASRIVPITVFVDGEYQDGGLYLAHPAPITVETDTVYELQQSGVPKGFFDVAGGENVHGSWFGFGEWKPLAAPKPAKKLAPSKHPPQLVQDHDPDRPHFKGGNSKTGDSGSKSSDSKTSSDDPDKPTLHRRDDSSTSADSGSSSSDSKTGSTTSSTTASDDPDRPTLHRRSDTSSDTGAGTAPDDPDRPHLKKRSDTAAKTGSSDDDQAPVTSANEADPDRPKMLRGRPAVAEGELEATKLTGMPADLQQMAAVSDSAFRDEHPFTYQWLEPGDAAKMQTAVEALATQVVLTSMAPPKPASISPATATHTTAHPGAPHRTLSHKVVPKPLPVVFSDKEFHAYELSYSGGATLVFTAKAAVGPNNAGVTTEKYVTIIAQPDFDGVPQVRLQSVTDDAHLDITPRMRLVDAVDTDGDNRAELVFELRHTSDRQFAIYRVRGLHAEQAFATESLPYGAPTRVAIKAN
jgi:hypothetical protein